MKLHALKITKSMVLEEWPELKDPKAISSVYPCELVRNRFLIGGFFRHEGV